jgi:ribosome-binding protein aMBF1 (putative translation factor)
MDGPDEQMLETDEQQIVQMSVRCTKLAIDFNYHRDLSREAKTRIRNALLRAYALAASAEALAEAQWAAQKAETNSAPFAEYIQSGQAAVAIYEARVEGIRLVLRAMAQEFVAIGKDSDFIEKFLSEFLVALTFEFTTGQKIALELEARVIINEAARGEERTRSHEPPAASVCSNGTDLGQKIRELRTHGWSIEDVADEVGVSRYSVMHHESGRAKPLPKNLRRYEALFEKELSELQVKKSSPNASALHRNSTSLY